MNSEGEAATTAPHILVVDDDTRLRQLLKRYLLENGYLVTTAISAEDARRKLDGLAFDALVLDVMMPGDEDGFALTRALRQHSDVPILLLTAKGEAEERIQGLEAGADDYLPKPFEPRELILRIEAVLRRSHTPTLETPLYLGEQEFDLSRGELRRGIEIIRLTTAEIEILRLFARNAGSVLSRAELAVVSTGSAGDRAVDVHIARLRRKIEPDPRNPRYLKTVWGEGYTFWPD